MSLATLPPELYSCILSFIPFPDRRIATLNLSRAVPHSQVSMHHLFEHISLSRQQQVSQLYWRLCDHPTRRSTILSRDEALDKERTWVKSLTLQTLQVDADILVNLLTLLPEIERLSLMIGTLFSPEHLEEIIRKRIMAVNVLSLRFRPYVQKATYYQFLKGSYFDETVRLLSFWPSRLSHLSIIQDPLPPLPSHVKPFAQPIVFFSFAPLTMLGMAAASQNITHLRLRMPSRQLVRFICPSKGNAASNASYFPALDHIDLSTCAVGEFSEIEALIMYTGRGKLRHIVLDETGLCNGTEGEWESLGRSCALAGVKRMRERERMLNAWIGAEMTIRTHSQEIPDSGPSFPHAQRRPRRGRRGLATAAISLRDTDSQDITGLPVVRHVTQSGGSSDVIRIRVLPPPPHLLSLSTSLPLGHAHSVNIETRATKARSDFAKGWSEGLNQLRATWARLRQGRSSGVRVVRFSTDSDIPSQCPEQEKLEGLVDMGDPGIDDYWEELRSVKLPVLCFAGAREPRGEHSDHPEGCGHRISLDAWREDS